MEVGPDGVAVIAIDNPPVNALSIHGEPIPSSSPPAFPVRRLGV
jgi:hypothetical protein